jgi:hypothetical protein
MKAPKKIAFVLDGFELRTAGQQLLDRFLIGYQRGGVFETAPKTRSIVAFCPRNEEVNRRVQQFGLVVAKSIEEAVRDADAIVTVTLEEALQQAVRAARVETPLFAYGGGASEATIALAQEKKIRLSTGTAALTLFRLPAIHVPAKLREALIVVQGNFPSAELDGLDGLFSFFDASATQVRRLRGEEIWQTQSDLLGAALSRSDKPQGHALEDGRTEDLVGLGLVQKMATAPRGWRLEHHRDFHSTILVLDGVVGDINVAFRGAGNEIVSTQLFQSPAPQEEHFSRLAAAIDGFFQIGHIPWPAARTHEVARLLQQFKSDFAASPRTGS